MNEAEQYARRQTIDPRSEGSPKRPNKIYSPNKEESKFPPKTADPLDSYLNKPSSRCFHDNMQAQLDQSFTFCTETNPTVMTP